MKAITNFINRVKLAKRAICKSLGFKCRRVSNKEYYGE